VSRSWLALCLGLVPFVAGPVLGQQKPEAATPAAAVARDAESSDPDYRIGPGDILEVVILRPEELTRTPTVQPNGIIGLPLIREVEVAGLTCPEAQKKITELLGRDYLVNPQVEVRVKEYRSQFVIVTGQVNSPGRKPLQGKTRLFDVLLASGGFTGQASGQVLLTRQDGTFGDGSHTLRVRLNQGAPTPKDLVNLELPLRHGDVLSALPKFYVTVEGEVTHPGRYVVEDDATVSEAILAAGGPTRFAKSTVKVRRIQPPASHATVFEVNLEAVRAGKVPDPPLASNDVVTVPRRLF
jgi:polysaccharide export outer membrane protein